MKKQILMLSAMLLSAMVFAQKTEIRQAARLLKKEKFAEAKTAIDKAGELVNPEDTKMNAFYYFTKGKVYYDIAKKAQSLDSDAYSTAAKAFGDLLALEEKTGRKRYSDDAAPLLKNITTEMTQLAVNAYNAKDYATAEKNFYGVYNMNKKDTVYLYNAASSAVANKDYDKALAYYIELDSLGYTGIAIVYEAVDKNVAEESLKSNKEPTKTRFNSKKEMDLYIKTGQYVNPQVRKTRSQRGTIIKNIALLYTKKGDKEKATKAVKAARQANPDDYDLLLTEANMYIENDDKDKFKMLMEEAILKRPDDPMLYYNLGAINSELGNHAEAEAYYEKAIALKPDYADAYLNLASLKLRKEKDIVDEMNRCGNSPADNKKYEKLKAKRGLLYRQVLPYLEKAYQHKKDEINIVQTLKNIYYTLDMHDKYKELNAVYNALKAKK